jgi:hypothetical protein
MEVKPIVTATAQEGNIAVNQITKPIGGAQPNTTAGAVTETNTSVTQTTESEISSSLVKENSTTKNGVTQSTETQSTVAEIENQVSVRENAQAVVGSDVNASVGAGNAENVAGNSTVKPIASVIPEGFLSETEMSALRTAGLSDVEIAQHLQLNNDIYLFRGTSNGWAGSPGSQATAVSASTDPYVATVFALEARAQGGQAVLQFGGKSKIGTFGEGNWMAAQEREVGVQMTATEFAQAVPNTVTADVARQALIDMGFPLPYSVATSDRLALLEAAPKMTPTQVAEFLKRIAGK